MSRIARLVRAVRHHQLLFWPLVAALGLLAALGVRQARLDTELTAIPFPNPVYQIDTWTDGHHHQFIGVLGVPVLADVDGDLIPDVTVTVGLVDARGLFNNPPDLGKILAPNVVIERFVKGVPLGATNPKLKVLVSLQITDLEGNEPDTTLRFGYDTGKEGSIPNRFAAVVNGLQDFFNPLEAVVDTKGDLISNGDTPFIFYEGPLKLLAEIQQGTFHANAGLAYAPFPDAVRVKYTSDGDGQHFEYHHGIGNEVHLKYGTDVNGSNVRYVPGELPEVDLTTDLALRDGPHRTDFRARIDRMPKSVKLDLNTGGGDMSGTADYEATSDGRLPDVKLDVATRSPGQRPLHATLNLDGLPQKLHANWSLPSDGPASARFDASGAGLRAVQTDIRNYDGTSPVIPTYVPEQQQFLNFQQVGTGPAGPDRRITGRVERIRHFQFQQSDTDGLDMEAQVGDGELPLLAHFLTDDRTATTGRRLEASATVAPLPDAVRVSFQPPAEGSTDPLVVTYAASEAVDVDGTIELFKAGAGPNCGNKGTLCASLAARHIPNEVVAKVTDLGEQMRVDIDSTLREGGAPPDFFLDALIGNEKNVPIVLHAKLLGAPEHVRVLTNEGADETLDRAEFHACDWDFDASTPGCKAGEYGPDDRVGELSFHVRNWLQRPADLPPPSATSELWASVVARGTADPHAVRFEAAGRITDIREVTYRNTNGIAGVRTLVGGGKGFTAHADLGNIAFDPDLPLATMKRFDVLADVHVPALPHQFDVCFRQSNHDVAPASGESLIEPCEDANPFDDADDLELTPLSFAYRASDTFDVFASGRVVDRGVGVNNTSVHDDRVINAVANVHNLPRDLTLHVQAPEEGEDGPIRAIFDAPREPGEPQVTVDADFQQTDGDMICKDPRVPGLGKQALCVKARLRNLPETALVKYDPTLPADNFLVETTGAQVMDIVGFGGAPGSEAEFSVVKRHVETFSTGLPNKLKGILLTDGRADVLLARGTIIGLPRNVKGTLLPPSTVDVTADPPIQKVDLVVQNFIAPDPLPPVNPATRSGVPGADQNVTFLQRGDHFRAQINVGDLRGAAYASAADADGELLDTKTVRVNFGPGHTIRAYADIAKLGDEDDPASLEQIIADVTIPNVPQGITVCFRGEKEATNPPVNPTFCDQAPEDHEGAFSVVADSPSPTPLNVHAFIRTAAQAATDVLSVRADLTGIPRVVQGTYAKDGKVTFGGFSGLSGTIGSGPTGIQRIAFDVSDFDTTAAGYPGDPPWEISKTGTLTSAFPTDPGGQNVRLRMNDSSMRVAGRIGDAGATGRLQSVLFDKVACPAPPSAPADYATYFPSAPPTGTTFTCIRAVFDPNAGSPNPLRADVAIDKEGKHIAFHSGGLSHLPDWVQLTLAESPALAPSGAFNTPCGPATPASSNPNCIPPLLRFDSASAVAQPIVAGVFEFGEPDALGTLQHLVPMAPVPSLDAVPPLVLPGTNNWSDWGGNPLGARLQLASFEDGPDDTRLGVKAGLRLAVPRSLTVDQVQSWTGYGPAGSGEEDGDHGKDIRFRYVIRDQNGVVNSSVGEAAGMINLFSAEGAKQILLTGDNTARGFTIPGETGINLYLRHHKRKDDSEGSDVVDKLFAQIDGRVSAPLTARARLALSDKDGTTLINALVQNTPATTDGGNGNDPSFRLRFQMDKDKEKGLSKLLCFVICVETDVFARALSARFNFAPNASAPAARVDAFVSLNGPKVALDARGFSNINPAVTTGAEIDANVRALLDPMDIFIHAGIPVLGAFDMQIISDLTASVNIDRASRFRLTANLLHIRASHTGTGHGSTVDIEFNPYVMWGVLHSIFGIFIGNPIIYSFVFLPPAPPPALVSFAVCPFPLAITDINSISLGAGSNRNLYGWLQNPPEVRFHTGGATGNFDLVGKLLSPVFCAIDADLINGVPHPPFDFPPHHEVPGTPAAAPADPTPDPSPPPPPPNLHVTSGTTALCGDHLYTTVTVDAGATLQVANVAGALCPAADVGRLTLSAQGKITISGTLAAASNSTGDVTLTAKEVQVASGGLVQATRGPVNLLGTDRVDINGTVNANGVSTLTTGTPAGNGGGAGHGGTGGMSGIGSGGPSYGDTSVTPVDGLVPSEAGSRGAGPGTPGSGGGVIRIAADRVRVNGTVTARGTGGSTTTSGVCADPDADPPVANTGTVGAGGGSGGGIVMAGINVDLTGGSVHAGGGTGGDGKSGGGGGGAGGIVKIISPILTGTPNVDGGTGGTSGCPEFGHGTDGGDGVFVHHSQPTSRVRSATTLWHKGAGFSIPVHGAAGTKPGNPGFTLIACGSHRPPQAHENPGDADFGIDMPAGNSLASPCGSSTGDSTVSELGRINVSGQESTPSASITPGALMTEGFWGLYTVAVKAGQLGNGNANNCFSSADNGGGIIGALYDLADCVVEAPPAQPDRIAAIDNTPPGVLVYLTGMPTVVPTQDVTITVEANDVMNKQGQSGTVPISGLAAVECSNDNATWQACQVGQQSWRLSPGSGPKTVYMRAIDIAGNVSGSAHYDVELDNSPPTSDAFVKTPASPDGANGWYLTSPTFRIENFDDGGADPPATGRFRYWINNGAPAFCDDDCDIPTNLPDGVHTFHWQAIDAIGNEEPVRTISNVKVDRKAPLSALLSVPEAPDGENGWYVRDPWVVISAVDTPGGSGLVNKAADTQNAGIFYRTTSNGVTGPVVGPIKPRQFTPFQLGAGSHDVCWRVVDVSGRSDVASINNQCRHFDVDLSDPTASLSPAGTLGDNDWFTSLVSVGALGADDTPGSGVGGSGDPELCTPEPPTGPTAPSGICVSVDGRAFVPYLGPRTIGEGNHDVRGFAVDGSGRRSRTVELPLDVDRSHPVSSIRLMAPEPARNGWWRSQPTVVLRAVDGEQNAGVRVIRYQLNGGPWTTYTDPFTLPQGVHTLAWQALDLSGAGNDEAVRHMVIPVDLTAPVAKALHGEPIIWSKSLSGLGLQPEKAQLHFELRENLASKVQVIAIVYDAKGWAVRRIDGGVRNVTPGQLYKGFVEWDGTDQSLTGLLEIGHYHFRVIAIDDAGNRTQTGESQPLEITLLADLTEPLPIKLPKIKLPLFQIKLL